MAAAAFHGGHGGRRSLCRRYAVATAASYGGGYGGYGGGYGGYGGYGYGCPLFPIGLVTGFC